MISQKDMQALTFYVRDGLTMNTASRELFEKALPGKPALVDAIVTAFQIPGIASGWSTVLLLTEPGNSWWSDTGFETQHITLIWMTCTRQQSIWIMEHHISVHAGAQMSAIAVYG